MNKITLQILLLFFITISIRAQVTYSANDQVTPYDGIFRPGVNPGYYGGNWNDFFLTDIVGGNPAAGTEGAGVRAFRSSLPEFITLIYDYPTWEGIYDYYDAMGMKDNTVIVGFAHPDHADPTEYCPGIPTDMFANLYEPIFDGGLNGTPINENNYFARYMWDLLESIGDHVKFWEIWNEPGFDYSGAKGWLEPGQPGNWWENNPDPCDYKLRAPIFHFVRTLRIAYQVIKTHSPDDYVVLSGVGFESFLDAVLRNTDNPTDGSVTTDYPMGGGAYFDVMGFHSYPHFDGSMRMWDNNAGGFVYNRHSDQGIEGFLQKKATRAANLANYGYDGSTYPLKDWMITEYNVPRVAYPDPSNPNINLFGSDDGARNFIMKSQIEAMKEGLIQVHPYQIAERETAANADDSFDQMGFFENLNDVLHFNQVIHEQGIGYKTTTDILFRKNYDADQSALMNLPSGIKGAAFKNDIGEFTYVLWARTTIDNSEAASGNYTFPPIMNIGNLEKRTWNFSQTGTIETISAQNISLDGSPAFFTPVSNMEEGTIVLACPVDSTDIVLTASLTEGGKNYNWTTPTATTTCPLGGLTVTQIEGPQSGSFMEIGGRVIAYEAKDACGNIVECGFTVDVRSTGGGIGNTDTGCHASREGFIFIGNYKGHKYFVSKNPMTYAEGLTRAEAQGGYLVTINSQGENDYLSFWGSAQAFIGYNDIDQEGVEVWENGEPIDFTNFEDSSCTWCESNTAINDAVEMHPWNGKWSWIPATDLRKVILEIPCAETLGCGCATTNEPVVGADGNTYMNACEAECAGVFNYTYGGNVAQITFTSCPTDINVTIPDGASTVSVNYAKPTATTTCPEGDLSVNIGGSGGPTYGGISLSAGVYPVIWNATDACGNLETCSFTITVLDGNTGGTDCPEDFSGFTTIGEFNGSKYYLSNEDAQPLPAQTIAESMGGFLVTINDQAENDFIKAAISEMTYIGLNDVDAEGDLVWFNGESFDYNNINPCSFCNQNSEEMDFTVIQPWDGAWSFSNLWNSRKYIVEIPCNLTPPNPGINISGCPTDITLDGLHVNNYMETATWTIPTATTDCPDGGLTITQLAGVPPGEALYFPIPSGHPIVYEFTDACGNSELCIFFIYVNPEEEIFECPDDITVTATSPDGAVVNYDPPTAISYCDPVPYFLDLENSLPSGSVFPIGTSTVNRYYIFNGAAAYCYQVRACSFTVTVLPPDTGGDCPDDIAGFTIIGEFGGSKYYLSDEVSRPTDAQAVAESYGGYLAAISSQEENDFIQQGISEMVYIGLNDYDAEGDLVWTNGEPFTFDNINPCGFCNENSEENDFVVIQPWDGAWSFSNFFNNRKYVMEVPCDNVTPPGINISDCFGEITVTGLHANNYTETVSWNIPTATTDCPDGGLTITQVAGSPPGEENYTPVGTGHPIVYEFTDACGNSELCVNFIFVIPEDPIYTCPPDITVEATSSSGAIVEYDPPTLISFCGSTLPDYQVQSGLPSGSEFPIGTTEVFLSNITLGVAAFCQDTEVCSFTVTVLDPNAGGCPPSIAGFTSLGEFNGSAYFLSDDVARPLDAEAVANSLGGHLATIDSQEENDFLYPQIGELAYIGLNDYNAENTLEWLSGDPVNFTNFDICGFCNENSEEMDFVVMHSWNGGWSWSNFYNNRKFIVEIPCTQTIENSEVDNFLWGNNSSTSSTLTFEKIIPNPATDHIFTQIITSVEQEIDLHIFDARGVLVKTERVNLFKGRNTTRVDISGLPNGLFFIKIPQADKAFSIRRFVKVRM